MSLFFFPFCFWASLNLPMRLLFPRLSRTLDPMANYMNPALTLCLAIRSYWWELRDTLAPE